MQSLPTQQFRIYQEFKSIDPEDFQGVIRLYDQYAEQIRVFDFEDFFDCTLIFANALYETKKHVRSVAVCTELLEIIIQENIQAWAGEDVYQAILLQKGASLWYLKNYKEASHHLTQFAKMYPNNETGKVLLRASMIKQVPPSMGYIRLVTVMLIMGALLTGLVDLILSLGFDYPLTTARQYYPMIFGIAVGVFFWNEIHHFLKCIRQVNKTIGRVKS